MDEFHSDSGSHSQATMVCPKCGKGQPRTSACGHCGVVITKYLKHHAGIAYTSASHRSGTSNVAYNIVSDKRAGPPLLVELLRIAVVVSIVAAAVWALMTLLL